MRAIRPRPSPPAASPPWAWGAGYLNAARAMARMADAPLTDALRAIAVPVHVIQGAEDVFCPRKAAAILREAMPQAGYAEIPQAGHLIAVDQPDRLAEAIIRAMTPPAPAGEAQ